MSKKLDQSIFKGKDKKWQWAAIDGLNSTPTLFTHKPKKSNIFDFYVNSAGGIRDLREDTGYCTKNWEDSLIEREGSDKIARDILKESIELLESGIAMNWSDMKKIEAGLNRGMYGMQIKLHELHLQMEGQQRQIHLAAEAIGSNKQAIMRIENKDKAKPKLKQLDQSVFEGLDKKWQFAAVDKDGSASYYDGIPDIRNDQFIYWDTPNGAGQSHRLDGTYNAKNWLDSLIEREAEGLTGSNLTRALKKERDWVLAYVSNENDVTAEFHRHAVVVTGITDNGDFICSDARWRHAVPVNHNGKILTAKEV